MLQNVLIALIKLRPAVSGYELKAIIDKSTGYFFSATLSQIYPALKILFENGYVQFKEEPLVGKQDRKVYTLTESGEQRLREWLTEPFEFSFSLMNFQRFLLKFTFMGSLEEEKLIAYLQTGLNYYEKEKKEFVARNLTVEREYLDKNSPDHESFIMLWQEEYNYILKEIDLRIDWIKGMMKKTAERVNLKQ